MKVILVRVWLLACERVRACNHDPTITTILGLVLEPTSPQSHNNGPKMLRKIPRGERHMGPLLRRSVEVISWCPLNWHPLYSQLSHYAR